MNRPLPESNDINVSDYFEDVDNELQSIWDTKRGLYLYMYC